MRTGLNRRRRVGDQSSGPAKVLGNRLPYWCCTRVPSKGYYDTLVYLYHTGSKGPFRDFLAAGSGHIFFSCFVLLMLP